MRAENGRSGEPFKGKGKARAAIPSWTEEDVEGEAVQGEEGGKEGAEGDGQVDEELERLVASILWQVRLQTFALWLIATRSLMVVSAVVRNPKLN